MTPAPILRPYQTDVVAEIMTLDELGELFNRQRPTPQATIEAIMHSVRERGLKVLKEPANIERLVRCNQAAKEQIDRRIAKLVAKGKVS